MPYADADAILDSGPPVALPRPGDDAGDPAGVCLELDDEDEEDETAAPFHHPPEPPAYLFALLIVKELYCSRSARSTPRQSKYSP